MGHPQPDPALAPARAPLPVRRRKRPRHESRLIAALAAAMRKLSQRGRNTFQGSSPPGSPAGRAESGWEELTPRERQILGLMCRGLSDSEIAHGLCLSPTTVRNHVASLYSKLDVHRRSAAIVRAHAWGMPDENRLEPQAAGKRKAA